MKPNAQTLIQAAAIAFASVLACTSSAFGAPEFEILSQNRQVVTAAVVINTNSSELNADDQLGEAFAPGPWADSVESPAQINDVFAFAAAQQDSSLLGNAIFGSGVISTQQTTAPAPFQTQAVAISSLAAYFHLGTPALVSLQATISDTSSSFMLLEGPDGVLAELSADAGAGLTLDTTLLLSPGYYAINASSGLDQTLEPGSPGITSAASWSINMTIIPAPGAAGFAMGAALFAARRRRR